MNTPKIILKPLSDDGREQFILDNQEAFRYGALEEFGLRDDHFEADGEIISRDTIKQSLNAEDSEAYCIMENGVNVGGAVLKINPQTNHNELELFFVTPLAHNKGIGFAAWKEIEKLHPETVVWETCTPYFEKRNIHFYINKCGFHAVEFFNAKHHYPSEPDYNDANGPDEMFRFEKIMK